VKITDELDEFIDIWEREFKGRLSREEAGFQANRLINLFELISRPVPSATPPSGP